MLGSRETWAVWDVTSDSRDRCCHAASLHFTTKWKANSFVGERYYFYPQIGLYCSYRSLPDVDLSKSKRQSDPFSRREIISEGNQKIARNCRVLKVWWDLFIYSFLVQRLELLCSTEWEVSTTKQKSPEKRKFALGEWALNLSMPSHFKTKNSFVFFFFLLFLKGWGGQSV